MEVTLNNFCNRVVEDTEKTVSKSKQYKAAVKYFNEMHEAGNIVPYYEAFTPFQNGVLLFLNGKFERQAFDSDLEKLSEEPKALVELNEKFKIDSSDCRYGYNYARKVESLKTA